MLPISYRNRSEKQGGNKQGNKQQATSWEASHWLSLMNHEETAGGAFDWGQGLEFSALHCLGGRDLGRHSSPGFSLPLYKMTVEALARTGL